MTILFADSVDRQENSDVIRWAVSLLLVLVFHFVVALWLLPREAKVEPNKPPPPAALLDLPPLPPAGADHTPGAPAQTKPIAPQTPLPPKSPAQVVKPIQPIQPESPPKLAVPLPEQPEAQLTKPLPPKPVPPKPPKPQILKTTPAPPMPTGSAAPVYLNPIRVWQLGVQSRFQKFKQWPAAAIRNQMRGQVGLRLEIDRQGNILSYSLAASSGYELLDRATLDAAQRMQRLPPLPSEIPGPKYELVLYIEWL